MFAVLFAVVEAGLSDDAAAAGVAVVAAAAAAGGAVSEAVSAILQDKKRKETVCLQVVSAINKGKDGMRSLEAAPRRDCRRV